MNMDELAQFSHMVWINFFLDQIRYSLTNFPQGKKSFDHFWSFLGFGISHSEGYSNSPRLNFVNFKF